MKKWAILFTAGCLHLHGTTITAWSFGSETPTASSTENIELNFTQARLEDTLETDYTSIGTIYFYPCLSLGHRWQKEHNGADFSLSFTALPPYAWFVKSDLLYLYIPKPNFRSQFYLGTGVGLNALAVISEPNFLITPELLFGYQYESGGRMRFAQIETGLIAWDSEKELRLKPVITFSYGFGF